MNIEKNNGIPLGNIAIYGLAAVAFITALSLGEEPLVNLLKQVSPNSILAQVSGMHIEIPFRENIDPVINASFGAGRVAVTAAATVKIITLSRPLP